MKKYKQGDIVLVPFPFSDLSSSKTRPSLVISNSRLKGSDVVLCAITSKGNGICEVEISDEDLRKGALPLVSYIKIGKVVSIDSSIIRQSVAELSGHKLSEVIKATEEILNPL